MLSTPPTPSCRSRTAPRGRRSTCHSAFSTRGRLVPRGPPLRVLGGSPGAMGGGDTGSLSLTFWQTARSLYEPAGPLFESFSAAGLTFDDQLAIPCTDSVASVYVAPDPLPAFQQGDIVRCARDRVLSSADVDAAARAVGYTGRRCAGRTTVLPHRACQTQRVEASSGGDAVHRSEQRAGLRPGPSARRAESSRRPRARVGRHRGDVRAFLREPHVERHIPRRCAFSPRSASRRRLRATQRSCPTTQGSGTEGPPAGSCRRTRLIPSWTRPARSTRWWPSGTLSTDGGDGRTLPGRACCTVLSAQAYAGSYGLVGNLVGVVAEAPLWLAERAWGAGLTNVLGWRPTNRHDRRGSAATQSKYFYGHGEVCDGPGPRKHVPERQASPACARP